MILNKNNVVFRLLYFLLWYLWPPLFHMAIQPMVMAVVMVVMGVMVMENLLPNPRPTALLRMCMSQERCVSQPLRLHVTP